MWRVTRKKSAWLIADRQLVKREEDPGIFVMVLGKRNILCDAVQVIMAREIQKKRFSAADTNKLVNAEMSSKECEELIAITEEADEFIKAIFDKYPVSTRGYYRLLKTARTIADLEGSEKVEKPHVAEAFQLRIREE